MFFRKKRKDYKFSVVMPVYNTEKYLDEAIGSIIDQSIVFKDNIQLIIVNDGSSDNSRDVCLKYKNRFPDNIIYIDQINQGVSVARNNGLAHAEGKYINFFDSDDIWNPDAFQLAWDFFQAHLDEIDVIGCIQTLFESKSGLHNLSNKFKDGDRVIDIWETPQFIQLNVCAAFIKNEVAKKYRFDTEIKIGEDAKYITEIILEKEKYGALQSAVHNVRKRAASTSITQNPDKSKFTDTIDRYYKYLPEFSIKKYGTIIPYVQHVIVNGLKYRVTSNAELPLTEDEKAKYCDEVIALIKQMDDQTLLKTNKVLMPAKLYMLRLKYGQLSENDFSLKGSRLYFKNILLGNLGSNRILITDTSNSGNTCTVKGELRIPFEGDFKVTAKKDTDVYSAAISSDKTLDRVSFNGEIITPGRIFTVELPGDSDISDYTFEISYNGHIIPQKIRINK